MVYDNRSGIGRYGMGMKTAALSMCPVMDLYSWQEVGAYYNMILDVEAIGKERANSIELTRPEPDGPIAQRSLGDVYEDAVFPG